MKKIIVLLLFALLHLTSCTNHTSTQLVEPPKSSTRVFSEHILYFIQPEFTQSHNTAIKSCMSEWSNKTDNTVTWEQIDWKFRGYASCQKRVVFLKYSKNDLAIKYLDHYLNISLGGYTISTEDNCVTNYILLVSDRLDNSNNYIPVTLHEIGHLLGLQHNENASIMNYSYMFKQKKLEYYDVDEYLKLINHKRIRTKDILAGR